MKRYILALSLFVVSFGFAQETTNQLNKNGQKHGLWKGTYKESKRPRYEGTFDNGKEVGVFKFFDDTKNGKVIATRDFSKGDGGCYVTIFDRKGNKVSEGYVDKNGNNQGLWKYYHKESKKIMSEENYTSGKIHGKKLIYYKEGNLANEINYNNGVKEGLFLQYSKDGVILEEIPYKNNQFHGEVIYRNPKGQITAQGKYEHGIKKGIWKFYENGKLSKEVNAEDKDFIYKGK